MLHLDDEARLEVEHGSLAGEAADEEEEGCRRREQVLERCAANGEWLVEQLPAIELNRSNAA